MTTKESMKGARVQTTKDVRRGTHCCCSCSVLTVLLLMLLLVLLLLLFDLHLALPGMLPRRLLTKLGRRLLCRWLPSLHYVIRFLP